MARTRQVVKSARSTHKVLRAALSLFSRQGFRATSMRQIARRAGLSVGNLYHHFGRKEAIFQQLLEVYWERLRDPELPLNKLFFAARFPDDIEELAAAIEEIVDENAPYILLIYIDVIEFRGKHLQEFYGGMAERFAKAYGDTFARRKKAGELGDVDPMVGVMVATRWFFYLFTIDKCFGVPMHFGMTMDKSVKEFARILRLGLLPRNDGGQGRVRVTAATRGGGRKSRR
jgi:AcrR family transcriptional regulator